MGSRVCISYRSEIHFIVFAKRKSVSKLFSEFSICLRAVLIYLLTAFEGSLQWDKSFHETPFAVACISEEDQAYNRENSTTSPPGYVLLLIHI